MRQAYPRVGLARLCRLFGVTRQAYYQFEWDKVEQTMEARFVLGLVDGIRREQPRMGTRKLHHLLKSDMSVHGIRMGRDALFDLLSSHGMLVRRRKHRPRTTFSNHWMRKYDNLVKGMCPYAPHQLWVSDITYLPLEVGFAYLSLICDAYSHKIVGYHLSSDLSAKGCLAALAMALRQLPPSHALVHHSDRGVQYCSYEYVQELAVRGIRISMTQSGDPYENAVAERLNGILKGELLEERYECLAGATLGVEKAVETYNLRRPHMSCGMLTPEMAHRKQGRLQKMWGRKEGAME